MKIYPKNSLIHAPLSGYTDLPYRRAARRCGCRFAFTEMVDAASLAYARTRGEAMLKRGPEEEWLGVQLVGAAHDQLKIAVDVLNEYDFDVLDFNLGCPVPKVSKKGAGAELGRHVDQALACFQILAERSRFPLTAKIRILSCEDPAPTLELGRGLISLGARAITIHGRLKEAVYSGPVAFPMIRAVREALPDTQIIANGGVMNRASYEEIVRETGCTEVMLARGAMGNPWLFREIAGPAALAVSRDEFFDLIREHVAGMVELYGEAPALRSARKILHDYFRGRGFHGETRNLISCLSDWAGFEAFLAIAQKECAGRETLPRLSGT